MPLVLHGYRYSVYVRIARLALAEKGVAYDRVEVNPFASDVPAAYLALHPFGRVPTLVHDDFALYETGAITRYLDRTFAGPALQPDQPRALGRMDQIIGVVDSYGLLAAGASGFLASRLSAGDRPAGRRGRGGTGSCRRRQGPCRARGAGGARRISRRARPVAGRSSSWRDDRLLRGRARRRSAAAEPSATSPRGGCISASVRVLPRRIPVCRTPSPGHRSVSAIALRPGSMKANIDWQATRKTT